MRTLLDFKNEILGLPPSWTDLVGYETLLKTIKREKTFNLDGEVVEIGAFLGGGTVKLAKFFNHYGKKVYCIDIFKPEFDPTTNLQGLSMAKIYLKTLKDRNQYDIFSKVTKNYHNIKVIKKDSKRVVLPKIKICFSFIDGCHKADYVRNDFSIVWDKTVVGGLVGFHDYSGDLPEVTETVDKLISQNRDSISKIIKIPSKWIIFLKKGESH